MKLAGREMRIILVLLTGGIISGLICGLANKVIVQFSSMSQGYNPISNLILLSTILLILLYTLRRFPKSHRYIAVLGVLAIVGALLTTKAFWGGVIFLSYLLCIHLSMNIFQHKGRSTFHLRELVSSAVGGGVGGLVSSALYHVLTQTSTSESIMTITGILLISLGFMLGLLADFWIQIIEKKIGKTTENKGYSLGLVSILLVTFALGSSLLVYISGLVQISEMSDNLTTSKAVVCSYVETNEDDEERNYSKSELIEFLSKTPDKDSSVIASLYLLTGKEEYAEELREHYITESMSGKFTDNTRGDKAKQYRGALRAAYYNDVLSKNPWFFTTAEKKRLVNWFEKINSRIFKVEWIDYIYAFLFKKKPEGPYENQEIGTAALSVFSNLSDLDKETRYRDLDYVKERGVGWSRNSRNPDDSFFYQGLWIKNAYFMSKYSDLDKFDNEGNATRSFEWMLAQFLPNGLSPGYNNPDDNRFPLDVMILGSAFLNDGRYKWIANRIFELGYEAELRNVYGLHYWDDELEPTKPTIGSCYIQGTTGIAMRPGVQRPDKIVFRDGWNEDSTYALLNLRFAGWHSYKATNSYVVFYRGAPFMVESISKPDYDWMLPSASRLYNDKKIDRADLNGIQVEKTGIEDTVYKLTGLGNRWSQAPPKFANVDFLKFDEDVDYARTSMSDWNGWDNHRLSMLIKNDSFLIIDHLIGHEAGKVRSRWHFKGKLVSSNDEKMIIENGQHRIMIYHPNNLDGYVTRISHEEYSRREDTHLHYANIGLDIESEGYDRVNFVLVLAPEDKAEFQRITPSKIQGDCRSAVGIKVEEYLIGSNIESSVCKWGNIITDADLFIQKTENANSKIIFENATIFRITDTSVPIMIELNGKSLDNNYYSYNFSEREIIIKPPTSRGTLVIEYRQK